MRRLATVRVRITAGRGPRGRRRARRRRRAGWSGPIATSLTQQRRDRGPAPLAGHRRRPSPTANFPAVLGRAAGRREPRAGRRRAAARVVAASANIVGEARISTLATRRRRVRGSQRRSQIAEGDGPFRVVARRVVTEQRARYTVYVAGSLERVARQHRQPRAAACWSACRRCSLLVGVDHLGGDRAARCARSRRCGARWRRSAPRTSTGACPSPTTEDEIGRLARTMNAMLARLEDATDRQRRFVADASHELRSPLTGIRAQLEVDLAHPEHADWQATERDVLDDAIRLQRLVDDLLDHRGRRRVGARRHPPRARRPRRDRARRGAPARSRTPRSASTRARCRARRSTATPTSSCASVRNLLDNAARHADSTVTVALHESESAAVLSVVDDGPGIPPDQRDRVFERFARLDDARTRDDGGTGLGLAIAQRGRRASTVGRSRSTATVLARGCASPCPCPSPRPDRRAHRPRGRGRSCSR